MRLQRYLALCGVASRRDAEKLIQEGRVTINGTVATLGQSVDPDADTVLFDGHPLSAEQKVYILLNKPAGTITTSRDTHGRKTVLDCIDGVTERLFPVGRLDLDVEGALLLTNDGDLANRMMHPSHEITKTYHAYVQGHVSPAALLRLTRGVELEDGMTAPAKAAILGRTKLNTHLRLTIHEGRNRQVKRMCAAVGHKVLRLRRTSIANLDADTLKPGEWRNLTPKEVTALRQLAGLPPHA